MKRTVVLAAATALSLTLAACGGGGDGSSIEAWCAVGDTFEQESPLDSADPTDPEAFRTAIEEFQGQLDEVRSAAPDEIRDDVNLVLDGFDGFFGALEEADFNVMEIDPAVLEPLNSEELNAASERITAFTEENCRGIGS